MEAKAQLVSATARLKILETRLIKTVVTSPVDGIFDRQFVDVGELVVPGASIFQVLVIDPVRVVAGIPERYALSVFPGTEAIVTFDIIIDQEYASPIEFMGISVDPRSRTIPIEIVINNAERLIRPFMVASVQVERIRQERVIVVSQDLVQRTEEGFQVFVAELRDGDVIARAKNVELGSSYANEVVITRGLVSGDKLITADHRISGILIENVDYWKQFQTRFRPSRSSQRFMKMAQIDAPRRELSNAFRIVKIDLIPRKLGANRVGDRNRPVTKLFSIAML